MLDDDGKKMKKEDGVKKTSWSDLMLSSVKRRRMYKGRRNGGRARYL